MKGDFSKLRFDPAKHFNRVLRQQGWIELDSDWNEQAAIGQHLLRMLIVDLLGAAGGPAGNCGFGLADASAHGLDPVAGDMVLSSGRYYVDGLLVEIEKPTYYSAQPDLPAVASLSAGRTYLAYLDVWERLVTYLEDDSIREVALGGPDTCTRVKTVWQVKLIDCGISPGAATDQDCEALLKPVREWTSGRMTARLQPSAPADAPGAPLPEPRYRGLENHLYRIEIHASGDTADANKPPTFKWSRDNGSIATRWLGTTGNMLRVASSQGFATGQWVEITSDADETAGQPGMLTRIVRVDGNLLSVDAAPTWNQSKINPKVRRWDQTANDKVKFVDGAVAIVPGTGEGGWIAVEDGIEVRFSAGRYRCGDYWLIPARVATGAIEWPTDKSGGDAALPPRGIAHHHAPLFLVTATSVAPFVALVHDCRRRFAPFAAGAAIINS
jgi:uncharacterized protein DUF6519